MSSPIHRSEEEWKEKLTEEEYRILREGATEAPFSGAYVNEKTEGVYTCRACGNTLFTSDTKFASGTGWPSFSDVVDEGTVILRPDTSLEQERTEVLCSACNSHLGHVFDDGPQPTGKRYCINAVALSLEERGGAEA